MTDVVPQSRDRAATALGVPVDAREAEVRSAFLKRLARDGFVPPEDVVTATIVLAEVPLPVTPDAAETLAAETRAVVDAFAAAYWSLPPRERRERWAELTDSTTDAVAARRLRQLTAGLDVAVATHPDAVAEEIAAQVREWFLLPPRERAVRRARWIVAQVDRFNALIFASRQLLKDDLPTARLDPALFDWFARARCPIPLAASARAQDPNLKYVVAASVLMLVGIAIAGALGKLDKKPQANPRTPPPVVKPAPRFSEHEVYQFERYEASRTKPQNVSRPDRYFEWVSAGRPGSQADRPPPAPVPELPLIDQLKIPDPPTGGPTFVGPPLPPVKR